MVIKNKIHKYLKRRLELPEIPTALERLASMNFQPNHIIDVGAYRGDFAKYCLDIWSNAKISCFEALEDKVVRLNELSQANPQIQVFPTLVGSENQEAVALNTSETASSVLVEHINQDFPVKHYPMVTIDSIVQKHFSNCPPDFLKLDVQGYELEVLKGAENSLSQMQVILAEVNFLDIHQNVPLLSDIVIWLNERDWVAYDICGLTRRPLDRTLWQADFIFVPRNSQFRQDKRWNA